MNIINYYPNISSASTQSSFSGSKYPSAWQPILTNPRLLNFTQCPLNVFVVVIVTEHDGPCGVDSAKWENNNVTIRKIGNTIAIWILLFFETKKILNKVSIESEASSVLDSLYVYQKKLDINGSHSSCLLACLEVEGRSW
jgi:hypothetical protein